MVLWLLVATGCGVSDDSRADAQADDALSIMSDASLAADLSVTPDASMATDLSVAGDLAGVVPLPTDPSIYGPIPEGAVYIFRAQYLTISGTPERVMAAVNVANPGVRDLTFPNPPLWLPTGGPDGHGAAQFDGVNDYGEAVGFSFQQGVNNQPSLQLVGSNDIVTDRVQIGASLLNGTSTFFQVMQIRTVGSDLYRTNGLIVGVPHNVDFLMPEASNDVTPHLHEGHAYHSGFQALFDGALQGTGGGSGTQGTLTTFRVASNPLNQYAAIRVSEVVITEGRPPAQAAAYRTLRIAREYPSLL
jgi:hypothetical protein